MDKNTITGFVLIALVVIGFSYFSKPSKPSAEEIARRQELAFQQDSIARRQQAREAEWNDAIAQAKYRAKSDSASLFHRYRSGEGQPVVLENKHVRLTLNTSGAMVESAEMKTYKNKRQGQNVMLLRQGKHNMQFRLSTANDTLPFRSRDFVFATEQCDSLGVTMYVEDDTYGRFSIRYTLQPDGYMLGMEVKAEGKKPFTRDQKMQIAWTDNAAQQEKGYAFESRYSDLHYRYTDGDVSSMSSSSIDIENLEDSKLDWIAFKNQFFSSVLIAGDEFTNAVLTSKPMPSGSGDMKYYTARMDVGFDPSGTVPTRMYLYLGPNDFHTLKGANSQVSEKSVELEGLIYLGWPVIRWINRWFILYLFDWLTGWGLPMGIVLLLLTVIVKMLVYPATKKSYVSSAKMRVLKPKVDALNQKYPDKADAMKKQQEMMQLYSQYGVSPMGGCLPMLIQMPIWIALFNFVPNAIELRGESFLWADDLSAYDDVLSWGFNIWPIGDHLSIFCLLFCATNIINTWISMRQQKNQLSTEQAQQMKMMRWMMYIMPVIFFFMFNDYSSGLCYYYFLSGLTSILIMWFLRKRTDDAKLLAKLEAYRDAHKNDPKKMSGMAARLEALQKMQEEQRKRKK